MIADDNLVPDLVVRIVLIQPDDLRARRHDFAHGQLIEFQRAVDDLAFDLVERARPHAFLHHHAHLLFGNGHFLFGLETEQAQQGFRGAR